MPTPARKSVSNIFWAFFSFIATKMLNLVAIVVLARLLSPAELGLMAFCMVVMAYFEILSRFGLGAALISAGSDAEEVADTADAVFALSVAFACVMAAILFALGPVIADAFDQPGIAPMLRVLSVAMLIEALGTVNNALLQKRLKFRLKVIPDGARGLVKGVVSIALALAGFGVWSLVYGYIAGAIAFCVVLHVVQPWLPRRPPGRDRIRRLLGFGGHLLGAESINMLNRTMSPLLIGSLLGAAALGIYNMAYRIPELAIKSFSLVAGTVAHPIMAEMQDDEEALRRYFYGCLCYFALFTFPGGAAVATLTPPLVTVLFTPAWYDMIVPMQLLAIAFALATVNILPGTIFKAIQRPGHMLRVSLITLPITVLTLWHAVPRGLEAVAAAEVALAIVYFVPNLVILRRAIGIEVAHCVRALGPGVICAAATALGGLAGQQLASTPLAQLVVSALGALAAFVAALAVVRPEVIAKLARGFGRRQRMV